MPWLVSNGRDGPHPKQVEDDSPYAEFPTEWEAWESILKTAMYEVGQCDWALRIFRGRVRDMENERETAWKRMRAASAAIIELMPDLKATTED